MYYYYNLQWRFLCKAEQVPTNMSKYGEDDTAPDLHGDDSYRAATNVVIQGKQVLLCNRFANLKSYNINFDEC